MESVLENLVPPLELDRALATAPITPCQCGLMRVATFSLGSSGTASSSRAPRMRFGRQPELLLHVAQIVAIVRVVPGVVREHHLASHVGDLGARRGIERDRRLVEHADAGVDVTGHVQRVADARHDVAIRAAAIERQRAVLVVPVMNAVVMRARMLRILREHLLHQELGADARRRPSVSLPSSALASMSSGYFMTMLSSALVNLRRPSVVWAPST